MSPADRQAERRSLLIDAAFDLLGTDGYAATTVRAVVERADLNPRYFYENFEDLDALLVAVYDRVVTDLGEVVLAAIEASHGEPAAQAAAVVRGTVEFADADRRRGRVLYVEGLGNERLNVRRMEAGLGVVAFIERYASDQAGLMGQERGSRGPATGDYISRVGATVLVGGFGQLLMDWLAGRLPIDKETLIADATEIFLALGDAAAAIAERQASRVRGKRAKRAQL